MRQAELQHARWAMLGVAGVLAQTVLVPNVFWYEAALHLPAGLGPVNLGSTLAFQFLMMHFVEIRRWQDIRKPGSVNDDPIFKGNKVPNLETGYPGGIFDPLNFAKGDMKELQTKEIKNGRLAMLAFMGFVFQAQTLYKDPLAALGEHLADPIHNNWTKNIGTCALPPSVEVAPGVVIPLICACTILLCAFPLRFALTLLPSFVQASGPASKSCAALRCGGLQACM